MKTKRYFIVLTVLLMLLSKLLVAIPAQEDFYHKYYKIESKGFSGKVLSRSSNTPWLTNPSLGEHVSISSSYSGYSSQQWIIAPISPNSSEFYIINKATGNPLMIDGTTIKCNTSGITNDSQRFKFKNVNGDYFQIQSASTGRLLYKRQHRMYNIGGQFIGYYYSLYYSTSTNLYDDYSYFKLTEVGDISGSSNVSTTNLVYQPNIKFNIPEPPNLTSLTGSAPEYSNETVIGESWIPFTLINDASYSSTVQVTQTPFYKLKRTQAWKKTKDFTYQPGATYTITYKKYVGITNSEKQTTQSTLEHSWSMDGKVEFDKFAIKTTLGVSYSEKLTSSITDVTEYTLLTWDEQNETLVFNTQASVRFLVYELVDRYYIERMNGSNVTTPLEIFYPEFYKFRTYPTSAILVTENPSTHTTTITDLIQTYNQTFTTNFVGISYKGTVTVNNNTYSAPTSSFGVVAGNTIQFGAPYYVKYNNIDYLFENWNDGNTSSGRTVSVNSHYDYIANYIGRASTDNINLHFNTTDPEGSPVKVMWNQHPNSNITKYEIWRKIGFNVTATPYKIATINRTGGSGQTYTYTDYDIGLKRNGSKTDEVSYDVKCYYSVEGTLSGNNYKTIYGDELAKQNEEIAENNIIEVPLEYEISNYPNPYNPTTTISYSIKELGNVSITVYDALGRKVKELVNDIKSPGKYNATFNGSNLSSGIYFYHMQINDFSQTKKMLLTK